jgi:hypothetical protein
LLWTHISKEGEPTSLKDYDYEKLYAIAKKLSKTKLRNIEFKE